MPAPILKPELRARILRRAGYPTNTTWIDQTNDGELDKWIQESYEDLYLDLVKEFEDYFLEGFSNSDIKTYPDAGPPGVAGVQVGIGSYSLPTDCLKLKQILIRDGTGAYQFLKRVDISREIEINPTLSNGFPTHYAEFGRGKKNLISTGEGSTGFRLMPLPSSASMTVAGIYIPCPAKISTGADGLAFSPDLFAGLVKFIVLDCAIKIRDAQEADCSTLILERNGQKERIVASYFQRAAGQPIEVGGPLGGIDEDLQELAFD